VPSGWQGDGVLIAFLSKKAGRKRDTWENTAAPRPVIIGTAKGGDGEDRRRFSSSKRTGAVRQGSEGPRPRFFNRGACKGVGDPEERGRAAAERRPLLSCLGLHQTRQGATI